MKNIADYFPSAVYSHSTEISMINWANHVANLHSLVKAE